MELEKLQSARMGDAYYQGRHPSGLEGYLCPMEDGTPRQAVKRLLAYSSADVVEAANRLQPAVFYRLKGGGA